MLVLSRKIGETIVLADGLIKIVICGIRGGQVGIGIEAPPEVAINRGEVQEAIDAGRSRDDRRPPAGGGR